MHGAGAQVIRETKRTLSLEIGACIHVLDLYPRDQFMFKDSLGIVHNAYACSVNKVTPRRNVVSTIISVMHILRESITHDTRATGAAGSTRGIHCR
jgi:hypothetical protein